MKILVIASESVSTSEVVVHALQSRFEHPKLGSLFLPLRTSLSSENQMVKPNYMPFLLEAEFSKHAPSHRLFNKKLYDKNPIANFEEAAADVIGVIPAASANALNIKLRLEEHGFEVATALVDFKAAINVKTDFITVDAEGNELHDDGFYDLHVTDETLRSTINAVGEFTCRKFSIGSDQNATPNKSIHEQKSSNPIVGTIRSLQRQSLRVAANLNGGKTINQQKAELIDDYLVELKKSGVKSFEDLPHSSKQYILERSYILKFINTYDMRNVIENANADLHVMAPNLGKLLSFAEMLQTSIDSIHGASTISDLTYRARNVDNLLKSFSDVILCDSANTLPKSVQAAIDETASSLLGVGGLMNSNDNSKSASYNSNFPASHALEELLQFYGDSVHTNIQNNEPSLNFRMQ